MVSLKIVVMSGLAGAVLRIPWSAGDDARHRLPGSIVVMAQTRFGAKPGSSRAADSGLILRGTLGTGPESSCVVAIFSLEL